MNKRILPVVTVVSLLIGTVTSGMVPAAYAASFSSGPFDVIEGYNFSDQGNGTFWQTNSTSAGLDEVVTVEVFIKNTSGETAQNVKVKLSTNVASGGDSATITATISADNASDLTDSFTVNLDGSGEIDSLSHTGLTKLYDAFLNQQSYSGGASSVVGSGLSIGNVASGSSNSKFVVAHFKVSGDNGGGGGSSDGPEVTTLSAEDIEDDSAVLVCDADAGDENTDVWFEWGEDNDFDEDTSTSSVMSNSSDRVKKTITGLDEDTTYSFRCVAEDDDGNEDTGSTKSFTTDDNGGGGSSDGPEVTTLNADDVDDNSALLVCDADAGDEDTDVWFEWGEDNDFDEDTSKVSVNSNDSDRIEKTITGLDEDTKYYFRCVAEDDGNNEDTGSTKSFTTDEDGGSSSNANEPEVVTISATGVNSTSATLRGEVDPNGDNTDAWFEWGTSASNLNRTTSQRDMGDGTNDVAFSAGISGLSENTTYYFRAMAENGEGDDQGSILSFRTGSPIVNVVTRFVDVFRTVEVAPEPEPEVEALIITLNSNAGDTDRREIDYTVSYDNRTGLTLTDVVLTVPMPNELDFVGSDPRESLNRNDELVYNIGTVRPGEQDSFLIETELDNGVDANDEIRFVAHVSYNDNSRVTKIVEVIDEGSFGEIVRGGGAFTAAIGDAFRGLFTNPLLWIILFILLVTFAVRYMLVAKD
ncbi:MAG: hypothetical protein NUV96_01435, partial [Candidatus Colwellbacteria bacterium]|nr:hypothetical protein [Candidatus Colwellbacteria bacterium]